MRILNVKWIAVGAMTLLCAGSANAQTKPAVVKPSEGEPKSILYIGNSFFYYNNGINGHVLALQKAANPAEKDAYRATMVTISGSGLDWHDVASYFRPNGLARYRFDEANNVVFQTPNRLYETAIIMDCSQCPIHPQLKPVFADFAKKDADIIRKGGANPVFFMSWAYADKPEMTAQLAEAYVKAANDNHALVIPAGLAFARSIAKKPELNLYQADKRHPSLAGTYLAAATVYAALAQKSPVGLSYTAGLDKETAAHLQQTAWETTQDFYSK